MYREGERQSWGRQAEREGGKGRERVREGVHMSIRALKFNAYLFWVPVTTLCFVLYNNTFQIRVGECVLIISDSEWCRVRHSD